MFLRSRSQVLQPLTHFKQGNTVKHPGLQETGKIFLSAVFTGGEVTLCVCSMEHNLTIFNAMLLWTYQRIIKDFELGITF